MLTDCHWLIAGPSVAGQVLTQESIHKIREGKDRNYASRDRISWLAQVNCHSSLLLQLQVPEAAEEEKPTFPYGPLKCEDLGLVKEFTTAQ